MIVNMCASLPYAIWLLKEMPDPRSVDPLIAALADPSGAVRNEAGLALGKICRFYGFESLEVAAASACWKLEDPRPLSR
jgi:hypothetical protein